MEPKIMNRWLIIAGAITIQLALGAIYAWSAFTTPLQGTPTNPSQYNFTKTETQLIFSTGLATFAVFMILGGRLQQKIAPRTVALGGLLLGAGYILSGLVGASFPGKLLTLGIVGGAGIGIAYGVPIAIGVKWFPDKKGLASGLSVAGFGFGSFIWQLIANPPTIFGFKGFIQTDKGIFTVANLDQLFMTYGVIFLIMVALGAIVMINPPQGYKVTTSPGATAQKTQAVEVRDRPSGEMLKTWQFYALWSMFAFGALAGLMVIGNVQNFARDPRSGFQAYGFTATQTADFAAIGAAIFYPILSGIGRITWGIISDKIGSRKGLLAMFTVQTIVTLAFFFTTVSQYLFYPAVALIAFNFGGTLSMLPKATADLFGTKNIGPNYGIMFTAYGAGGIAGPILAGIVQDYGLSFLYAFIPASVLCLVATVLAFILRPPRV